MRLFLAALIALLLLAGYTDRNHQQDEARGRPVDDQTAYKASPIQTHTTPEPDCTTDQKKYDNPGSWYKKPEWVLCGLTAIYVIATIVYVCFAHQTLRQIANQAEISKEQVRAMWSHGDTMRLQWRAAYETARNVEAQLVEMGRQTTVMGQQASVMLEQMRMTLAKEMAIVRVDIATKKFVLGDHVGPNKDVGIRLRHFGLTEAYNVFGHGIAMVHNSYDFPSQAVTQLIAIPDVMKTKEVPVEAYVPIWPMIEEKDIPAIIERRIFVHVFGVVTYNDFLQNTHTIPFWYTARMMVMQAPIMDHLILRFKDHDLSYWEWRTHPELERQIREYKQQYPDDLTVK
jgi:hypothetical protein